MHINLHFYNITVYVRNQHIAYVLAESCNDHWNAFHTARCSMLCQTFSSVALAKYRADVKI